MEIFDKITPYGTKTAVALGYFDGVHRGHEAVLRRTVELAERMKLVPIVFTFNFTEARPSGKGAKDVMRFEDKVALFEQIGIKACYHIVFSELESLSTQQFVDLIMGHGCLNAAVVCCGADFRLGKGREGDVKSLRKLCGPYGTQVFDIRQLSDNGVVSTTRIKAAIESGDMALAEKLCGHSYRLPFTVIDASPSKKNLHIVQFEQLSEDNYVCPKAGIYSSSVSDGVIEYPSVTIAYPFRDGVTSFDTYALDAPLSDHVTVELTERISSDLPSDRYDRDFYAEQYIEKLRTKL